MIKIILIIVAVFIVYCLIEMIRELRDFRVTKYRICSQKLNGIKSEKKIIFLSDLHNRMYGEENERLLESIRNQHPDLILIGGDMLVRKDGNSYDKTVHFLAKLPGICPVYCANGNHEQKLKELPDKYEQSYEEYKKALTASGIHMLENASETVKLEEVPVKLSGLEIPLGAYARFGKKELSLKEITDRIGEHGDDYQILFAHHPRYIQEYLEITQVFIFYLLSLIYISSEVPDSSRTISSGQFHNLTGTECVPSPRLTTTVCVPSLYIPPEYFGNSVKSGEITPPIPGSCITPP